MSNQIENSLHIIKKQYLSMSEVEKRISDYILNYPEKVVNMTTSFLASETGVSEGSIINFSKQIGFSGFTKLKINIAQSLENHKSLIFEDVTEGDSPKTAVHKMIENTVSAFRSTYDILSEEDLQNVADLLMNVKKRIEIYGVGSSSMIANDAYYRLMRIGLPVYAVTDPHISSISASLLDDKCLAIGISHSGRTNETLEAMEIAKSKNAKTICITSYADSPLAKICDISIVIASKEAEVNREAVVSRLTQLLVLDSLCSFICYQRKDETNELMENVIDIIGKHRK